MLNSAFLVAWLLASARVPRFFVGGQDTRNNDERSQCADLAARFAAICARLPPRDATTARAEYIRAIEWRLVLARMQALPTL